jgi:Bacteriophage replication gene A protein (GPA)
VIPAAEITPYLHRNIWRWRDSRLSNYGGAVRAHLLEELERIDRTDYAAANLRLGVLHAELKRAKHNWAFDEQEIRDHAENYARLCSRMLTLEVRAEFCAGTGVRPPTVKGNVSRAGAIARMDDPLWWRRQLRKTWTRSAENAMRDLGVIRRGRAPYASDDAVRHRAAQKRRMRSYLENSVAVNELGEQLSLFEVAEKSNANPAIRRAEFMTRCRGFEEIAKDLGHVAEFVTLTAPSYFHAQLASGGRNPAFQRAIVRDAQAWLCRMWARARAKLKRLSILIYGFRIAEPHHDATPHWHLLLFCRAADAGAIRMVLSQVWLSDFGHEPGAQKYRAKFETIDPKIGSATGYVAKYIAKNIDGDGGIGEAEDFETGASVNSGIVRVDAWASIHGIRQFQQLGGVPVGLWREARRLRDPVEDPDVERARLCADAGDWRGFSYAAGCLQGGKRLPLKLESMETGEKNKYGELRPARIVGLRYCSSVALTRPHRWRIEHARPKTSAGVDGSGVHKTPRRDGRRAAHNEHTRERAYGAAMVARSSGHVASASLIFSPLGPVAITVRGASNYNEPSSWTNPNETSQAGPN